MSRGTKTDRSTPPGTPRADNESEITDPHAEVHLLRAELRTRESTTTRRPDAPPRR